MTRPVPYVDLPAQLAADRAAMVAAMEEVLDTGDFIGGKAVSLLEEELAAFHGARHAIALNSGTDALILSLRALDIGPGDEVITAPNSFIASAAAIAQVGARPVFADVLPDQNIDPKAVERAIGPRTKAIMPVHLTGRVARMDQIMDLARCRGLQVIEDAAQSVGSRYQGRMAGTFGIAGCFSLHPLKNLAACGDGGFVVTDDDALADRLRRLRNHGLADRDTATEWGLVSRLDTIQAALLRIRLKRLPEIIEQRRRNAALYQSLLDPASVFAPPCRPEEFNSFHTFVIQVEDRDGLKAHLANLGIGSAIHYPKPIHLQPAANALGCGAGDFPVTERQAGRILSLPINHSLEEEAIRRVAAAVNGFAR